jgi:hypothetical protein
MAVIQDTVADHQLLRQYATDGSAEAFRLILNRYIDLVHAAAASKSAIGIWRRMSRRWSSCSCRSVRRGCRRRCAVGMAADDDAARVITLSMVTAQTKKPIRGAMVQVRVDNKTLSPAPADASGKYVISLPNQFASLEAIMLERT